MPGWAIFQSATLGQFCIGANKLERLVEERALPETVVSDNGTELTSGAML